VGDLVSVDYSAGSRAVKRLSEKSISGKVGKNSIGSHDLSDDVEILDVWEGSAVPVSLERIRGCTLDTHHVRYVAYDAQGRELFRSISLWVLMDRSTRAMVLPGKSGIMVPGILRGNELPSPNSLSPVVCSAAARRRVCYSDLDVNDHMNNCRYLEWMGDLLPAAFHKEHAMKDVTMCYLGEAREGDELTVCWEMTAEGVLQVDIQRQQEDKNVRIFTAEIQY
jgi:hypothetical protein